MGGRAGNEGTGHEQGVGGVCQEFASPVREFMAFVCIPLAIPDDVLKGALNLAVSTRLHMGVARVE